MIQEREENIIAIQRNMQDCNEIFVDLANQVDEQGGMLGACRISRSPRWYHVSLTPPPADTMEWNIQEANQRTERGVKHLVTATKHQNKHRKSVRWRLVALGPGGRLSH